MKTNSNSKKIVSSTILGMVAIAVLVASVSVPHMQAFANTFRGDSINGQYTVTGNSQAIGAGTGHCITSAAVIPTAGAPGSDKFTWSVASPCTDTPGSGQTGHIDLVRIIVDGTTYDYDSTKCSDLRTSTSCGTTNTISITQTSGSIHSISFTTYYRV